MSIFENSHSRMSDFDNVTIEENDDLIMIIEGPNTNRTIFILLSFLVYLFSIFVFYSFLPDSKYSQIIPVGAGETKKIDVTNAYRGNFIIKIYSIKSQVNLNSNKLYFGQFRINLSVKYLFDNQKENEIISNNFLIEPEFELDQNISFPITIYESELPKHVKSLSIIFTSERISINSIALEFVFDNSVHFSIDLTWNIIHSFILFALIFKYCNIAFNNNKKKCRFEQKLILIYLIILSFGCYPICFLLNYNAYLQNIQKSLSNSFYLCLILMLFKSIKLRGKKISLSLYISISIILTIIDLIDTEFSFHSIDAFIGVFYLILYLYEFIGASLKYDETEQFKFRVYTTIFVFIPLLLFLSRVLTKWCGFLFLKHLKVIFSNFANYTFAFLLAYLFYPMDPTDDVEYSRFHK